MKKNLITRSSTARSTQNAVVGTWAGTHTPTLYLPALKTARIHKNCSVFEWVWVHYIEFSRFGPSSRPWCSCRRNENTARDADSRFGEMLAKYHSTKKPVLVYYDNSVPYGVIICAHNNIFYWQQLSSSSRTDKRGGSFPTNMTPRNRIFICMPIWVCGMVLYYNCSTREVLVCCRRGLVQASTGHAAASRCYFAVWYCVCRIWI